MTQIQELLKEKGFMPTRLQWDNSSIINNKLIFYDKYDVFVIAKWLGVKPKVDRYVAYFNKQIVRINIWEDGSATTEALATGKTDIIAYLKKL